MTNTIPSLCDLCVNEIIRILEESKFCPKLIKECCQRIPDHLAEPIFDVLQSRGLLTNETLQMFLVPFRTKIYLSKHAHLKKSALKQIGYHCRDLVSLDLSDCVQVTNSVVCEILHGCQVLSELVLDRCHRITDAAFGDAQSPYEILHGLLSLETISMQVRHI